MQYLNVKFGFGCKSNEMRHLKLCRNWKFNANYLPPATRTQETDNYNSSHIVVMQEQSWHTRRGKCAQFKALSYPTLHGWRTLHVHVQTHLLSVRAFKDAAATNSQPGFCVAARRPNYNLYSFTDRKQASTPVGAHTPNLVIGSRRERHHSDKSSIRSVCCGAVKKKIALFMQFMDRKR